MLVHPEGNADGPLVPSVAGILLLGKDPQRFFPQARVAVVQYAGREMGESFLKREIEGVVPAQLEEAERITRDRLATWAHYHRMLEPLEAEGLLRRPIVPVGCADSAHIYYVLLAAGVDRQRVLGELKSRNINCVTHYVPLHSSPAGQRYGRAHGMLEVTDRQSSRLLRLPLWVGLSERQQRRVAEELKVAISKSRSG